MEFIHIKDGDYTCEQWFHKLNDLCRESKNDDEITVIRNDSGFAVMLYYRNQFEEVIATFIRISDAYDYIREYLIKHKETGFFIV